MASRYLPPRNRSSRNLAQLDTRSTAYATGGPEPLNFSNIHVSIDTNGSWEYDYNSHYRNPQGQSQSSHRYLDQIPAVNHEMATRPRATPRFPMRVFNRSTGRYVRPIGPPRPSSALEIRRSSRGHIEHTPGVDPLLSGAPRSWIAVGNYLCWPEHHLPPFSLDITALESSGLIPIRPQAPFSDLRPVTHITSLVSLTEIATRFGVEQDAIQTLNASVENRGALKFVVLFENDNHTSGCYRRLDLFTKTNLHLLPGYELPYPDQDVGVSENGHSDDNHIFSDADLIDLRSPAISSASERVEVASSSSTELTPPSSSQSERSPAPRHMREASDLAPIAVFQRVRRSDRPRTFRPLGLYEIEETEFFAPETFALVKMLEQRSGGRASRADLECEWARIRLVRPEQSSDM